MHINIPTLLSLSLSLLPRMQMPHEPKSPHTHARVHAYFVCFVSFFVLFPQTAFDLVVFFAVSQLSVVGNVTQPLSSRVGPRTHTDAHARTVVAVHTGWLKTLHYAVYILPGCQQYINE